MKKLLPFLLFIFLNNFSKAQITSANPDTIENNLNELTIRFYGNAIQVGTPLHVLLIQGNDTIESYTASRYSSYIIAQFHIDTLITAGQYSFSYNDPLGNYPTYPNMITFFTATPTPVPTLISPVNNFIATNSDINFRWSASGGPYEWKYGPDSNFVIPASGSYSGYSTIMNFSVFNGDYFWRVRANRIFTYGERVSEWSPAFKITGNSTPSLVSLTPNVTYKGNTGFCPSLSGLNTHFLMGSSTMTGSFSQGSTIINNYLRLDSHLGDYRFDGAYFNIPPTVPSGLYDVNYSNAIDGQLVLYSGLYIADSHSISGSVYYDMNSNGVFDTGDIPYEGMQLYTGNNNLFTDPTGLYTGYLPDGTYTISLGSPLQTYYTASPSSHTVTFGIGDSTGLDFALTPIQGMHDVMVQLSSLTWGYRIGTIKKFSLLYRNKGTEIENGQLKFIVPQGLTFSSSSNPNYTMSGDTMIWNYTNLGLNESRNIILELMIPANTPMGTVLSATLSIETGFADQTPNDNLSGFNGVASNSFDPNNKSAFPDVITQSNFSTGEYLSYTINFQNTGNDTAYLVRVLDTISNKLDLSTLEMLDASHSVRMISYPDRVIEFRFDNINLLDSTSNEELSHGFVSFRIKTLPNLTLVDNILNTSYIYFDNNAPIRTNDCITLAMGVDEFDKTKNDLVVYPNPAKSSAKIIYPFNGTSKVVLHVYDITGKKLIEINYPSLTKGDHELSLDVSRLTNGVYRLVMSDGKTSRSNSLVIEK